MFSTPLICCSSGATTVAATTSALAPGYWPLTLTTGGAISGYWAIGSLPTATAPTMTKTIEITAAKIGRSMKKWERRMAPSARSIGAGQRAGGGRRGGARSLRRNLRAGAHPHQAVDDDVVVRLQTLGDDAQAVDDGPERHVFGPRDAVVIDDQHELARLFGSDGGVGYEERDPGRRRRHLNPRKHPGHEDAMGVGELGAGADGAERAIDRVVDEIHPAFMGKRGLVEQLELDRYGQPAVGSIRAVLIKPRVAEIRGLIHGKLEADGIGRLDGGEQGGASRRPARDQIPDGDAAVSGAPGHRGAQLAEFEVERRLAHDRLLRGHRGLRRAFDLRALVERLLGDHRPDGETLGSRQVAFREGEIGPRLREARL